MMSYDACFKLKNLNEWSQLLDHAPNQELKVKMARFEAIRMLTRYEAKDALPILQQVLLSLELGTIVHALTQLSV